MEGNAKKDGPRTALVLVSQFLPVLATIRQTKVPGSRGVMKSNALHLLLAAYAEARIPKADC